MQFCGVTLEQKFPENSAETIYIFEQLYILLNLSIRNVQ